jgi:hypothetical protein
LISKSENPKTGGFIEPPSRITQVILQCPQCNARSTKRKYNVMGLIADSLERSGSLAPGCLGLAPSVGCFWCLLRPAILKKSASSIYRSKRSAIFSSSQQATSLSIFNAFPNIFGPLE